MAQQDDVIASEAAHARFAQNVEQQQHAAPAPIQPNESDLQWLNQMQGSLDESGRRRYEHDSKFRTLLEKARQDVFASKSIANVRAATEDVLAGREAGAASEPQRVVEPQGTPESRAETELVEHLEAGGQVGQADVDAATWQQMTAGYTVNLPDTHVLNLDHCDMLANARAAGISQATVDQYIKTALRN